MQTVHDVSVPINALLLKIYIFKPGSLKVAFFFLNAQTKKNNNKIVRYDVTTH